MKFGRLLRNTSETLPETRQLFNQYKGLKKQLRRVSLHLQQGNAQAGEEQERSFIEGLKVAIQQLNEAFLEREEDLVMKLEELETESGELQAQSDCEEAIRKLADFHGETLLFMYWSMLAYTAALKILKKHQKKTGHVLPGLRREDLTSLPICSTEISSTVVQRVEDAMHLLNDKLGSFQPAPADSSALSGDSTNTVAHERSGVDSAALPDMSHRTRVALETWQQLISGATTPSTVFSMGGQALSSSSSHGTLAESEYGTQELFRPPWCNGNSQ